MPSGYKKKRGSKRKNAAQNLNPIPIPNPPENGKRPVVVEEEEGEEKFETPRFDPDPIDMRVEKVRSKAEKSSKDGKSDGSVGIPVKEVKLVAVIEEKALEASSIGVNGEAAINGNGSLEIGKGDVVGGNGSLENEVPTLQDSSVRSIPVAENSKDVVVDSVQEVLPQIDEDLKEKKMDDSAEVSVLVTEEGIGNLSCEREVKEMPQVEETETEPLLEVARGPLVVQCATIWNCCGLLDVLTGSGS